MGRGHSESPPRARALRPRPVADYKGVCSRPCWKAALRACVNGWPRRSARTEASSHKSRIRPIRFRSRRVISRSSSKSATSRAPERAAFLRAYSRAHHPGCLGAASKETRHGTQDHARRCRPWKRRCKNQQLETLIVDLPRASPASCLLLAKAAKRGDLAAHQAAPDSRIEEEGRKWR